MAPISTAPSFNGRTADSRSAYRGSNPGGQPGIPSSIYALFLLLPLRVHVCSVACVRIVALQLTPAPTINSTTDSEDDQF